MGMNDSVCEGQQTQGHPGLPGVLLNTGGEEDSKRTVKREMFAITWSFKDCY